MEIIFLVFPLGYFKTVHYLLIISVLIKQLFGPLVLRLRYASGSLRELVEVHHWAYPWSLVLYIWGGAQECAFLTRAQLQVMLLVRGLCFENPCFSHKLL